MTAGIQEGVAFESGTRPQPCYRLVLLNAKPGAEAAETGAALAGMVAMLHELTRGLVRELKGMAPEQAAGSREQFSGLHTLLAYGRRLFDHNQHRPPLTRLPRPDYLAYLPANRAPFPSIPWAEPGTENDGEADFALQLTGPSEATVNCAAVECWKLLEDERVPLAIVATFSGFGRPDGRGWLEFHDGVSNMASSQRLLALEAAADPAWMEGGTYMAFLRLTLDLAAWQALERHEQELVIGRDKLTGAALTQVRRVGDRVIPVAGKAPRENASREERAAWRDPAQTTEPLIEGSHIHRANQNRASPGAAGAFRMFRQGYDFLDGFQAGTPVLGLNFVSFQRDLRSLQQVMHLPSWLGDANFGGPNPRRAGDARSPDLIRLAAGGLYAVPPRADPFPGCELFDSESRPSQPASNDPRSGSLTDDSDSVSFAEGGLQRDA